MKKIILSLMILLTISTGFCAILERIQGRTDAIEMLISRYSDYVGPVLPFTVNLNITDTNETILMNISKKEVNAEASTEPGQLNCRTDSNTIKGLFNATSSENATVVLSNKPIRCKSKGVKGELVVNAVNGALGGEYIILDEESVASRIVKNIINFFNWLGSFF